MGKSAQKAQSAIVTGLIWVASFILGIFYSGQGPFFRGIGVIGGIYFVTAIFIAVCPCKPVAGYVAAVDSKSPHGYCLVGFQAWICTVVGWAIHFHYYEAARDASFFADRFWANFLAANFIGHFISWLAHVYGVYGRYSTVSLAPAGGRCRTRDQSASNSTLSAKCKEAKAFCESRNMLVSYFNGWAWNPQWNSESGYPFDFKIYLYVAGAVVCQLKKNFIKKIFGSNLLGLWAASSRGVAPTVVLLLMTFFNGELKKNFSKKIFGYLYQEQVHIYTYDFFCERIGMKLIWGCFLYWPFVYTIPLWPFAKDAVISVMFKPEKLRLGYGIAIVCFFFCGWVLTRGANLQKFYIKTQPTRKKVLFGVITQRTLHGSKGRILVSGFWGIARHINYLGENIQAWAVTIPALLVCESRGQYIALIYPIYYAALMIPRCLDDSTVCEQKYGKALWGRYLEKVPYKMIPGLF